MNTWYVLKLVLSEYDYLSKYVLFMWIQKRAAFLSYCLYERERRAAVETIQLCIDATFYQALTSFLDVVQCKI